MTHTRVHVQKEFANPYLICDKCGQRVKAYHDSEFCGCNNEPSWYNIPCECSAGVTSKCYSWNPVDGCNCTPECTVNN